MLPVGIKSFTRASFFELTAPIMVAVSYARDLQGYWSLRLHTKSQLIEAGRDLARTNATYELAVQQNSELQAEIARLEGLFRLPALNQYRYEHARVARREFSAWWQQIEIRKGRNFGIPVDAPVIFSGGVVGRVRAVHATTATVELISSPTLRLAGVIEGDSRPISFQGGNNASFAPPRGILEFVPLDINITPKAPKRLVTSGLGGVFPPGLIIGKVTGLTLGNDGMFQSGIVQLDERLGALTEVTVLVPLANP
ncbi:rod shape-determining protein MreC [Opitutus sp. ER46]|nr:rod shape-determining protein MreC [Opitutus sp. ER46]